MRFAHQATERRRRIECVEQVAQRTRQDPFNLHNLVAARDEIAEGRHDREARADVGFVEKMLLAPLDLRHQRRVAAPRQRVGLLVRRDEVQVRLDERGICVHDRLIGRAVDERRVGQLHRGHALGQHVGAHALSGGGQYFLPMGEIDALALDDKPLAVGQSDDGDLEPPRQQVVSLLVQLAEQGAADVADADDGERETFAGLEEGLMDGVQGAALLRRIDDARDVPLGRALRDGVDVDVVAAERVEQLAGHARAAFHALADDRENGLIALVVDHHQLIANLVTELSFDGRHSPRGVGRAHRETDRVLRRGLRNEDDVDALGRQRPKQPLGDAGHAHHPGPAEREERQLADRRHPFCDRFHVGRAFARNQRAGRGRVERVLDQDRDSPGNCRRHGGRVNHLRTEVRQLHRLFVGHLRQHESRRHESRIRAEDAVHVGPDLDHRRAEGRADDRGAVVRPVPADGRRLPVAGRPDEPGDDRNRRSASAEAAEIRARSAVRPGEVDVGVGELVVGRDEVARVGAHGVVKPAQIGREDDRGEPLAEAGGHVERAQRTVSEQMNAFEGAAQLGQQRFDFSLHVPAAPRPGLANRPVATAEKRRHGHAMTAGDLAEEVVVLRVAAFRETRTLEKLIRHPLECRHHDDDRLAAVGAQHDCADRADGGRRRERRSTEFQDSHGAGRIVESGDLVI